MTFPTTVYGVERLSLDSDFLAEVGDSGQPRVQRSLLSRQVAGIIREQILMGKLLPGHRITQAEWAARLGVSRMPVRDALSALTAEGLLVQIPGGSAEVARMDVDDMADVLYLNAVVVALAHRAAATRITEAELAEVSRINEAMKAAADRDDRVEVSRLNWALHSVINRASRSTRLMAVLRVLASATPQNSFEVLPGWAQEAEKDHVEIIEALRRGDAESVFLITHRHVTTQTEPLLDYVAGQLGVANRRRRPPPEVPPPA